MNEQANERNTYKVNKKNWMETDKNKLNIYKIFFNKSKLNVKLCCITSDECLTRDFDVVAAVAVVEC